MSKKTILTAGVIVFVIIAGILYLIAESQQDKIQPLQTETQNAPTETITQTVKFYFEPTQITLAPDEETAVLLKASFTPQDTNTTLDYLKTEINIPAGYVMIPEDNYIVTEESQFNTIVRVDGPEIINETGKITIELTTDSRVPGPITSQDLTVARIVLRALPNTTGSTQIGINPQNTQVTNNKAQTLNVASSDSLILEVKNSVTTDY